MSTSTSRERQLLNQALTRCREHVLGNLEGLSDEDLARATLPSGWTCAGLVQHLAVDVERWWFRRVVAGEALEFHGDAWKVDPGVTGSSVLDLYRRETELADAVIAATPLDAAPAWWPADRFAGFRLDDLREVLLHVITETATHAGHVDAARELIDGTQWVVLT